LSVINKSRLPGKNRPAVRRKNASRLPSISQIQRSSSDHHRFEKVARVWASAGLLLVGLTKALDQNEIFRNIRIDFDEMDKYLRDCDLERWKSLVETAQQRGFSSIPNFGRSLKRYMKHRRGALFLCGVQLRFFKKRRRGSGAKRRRTSRGSACR
jgi:hypothetical protein